MTTGPDRAHRGPALGSLVLAAALAAAPLDASPMLRGRVLGPGERPLTAVRVKIYVCGVAAASVWADSTGAYAVELPAEANGATVMAWFVPVNEELAPECVILAESAALSGPDLLPCVPRIEMTSGGAECSPTLLDAHERLLRLKGLPCFEESIQSPP